MKRFESLDAFRGIAALMVAIFHLNVIGVISNIPLIRNSFLLVEFFFVLSGFVISYSYNNKVKNIHDLKDFTVKRFARIWPLHIFMTLLFIPFALANIILGLDLSDRFSLYSFISSFFLIQSFTMTGDSWNLVAWSISSEFYTYILFGALSILPFFNKRALLPIIIIFMSLLLLNMDLGINKSIFRCLPSFFLGCLAFRYYRKLTIKPWMEFASITLAVIPLSFFQGDFLYSLMPLLFFIMVIVFSHETGSISKVLKLKPFQILGVLSYSIYLTHAWFIAVLKSLSILVDKFFGYNFMLIIDNVRFIDFNVSFNDLVFIPYLGIVIIFSYITHRYIEMPYQKKILNFYFLKKSSYAY